MTEASAGADPSGAGEPQPGFGRPSPAAASEPKLSESGAAGTAGWRADGASSAWCALRAASVVGVRHRLAGRGSDDSYAWALGGDRLALAVADGVGSLGDSAPAADLACRVAVSAALRAAVGSGGGGAGTAEGARKAALGAGGAGGAGAGAGGAGAAAVAAANRALGELFAPHQPGPPAGATTLVVAVVDAAGCFELARVGDSSAWRVGGTEGGELFPPPDPERAGGATEALPASTVEVETTGGRLAAGEVLCLVTDGVADPWRDGPNTVAPALESALLARPGPLELLELAGFSRQGCHDDRTLVAVWIPGTGS